MSRLIAALTVVRAYLREKVPEPERGSVTMEHVLWAVAVIAIVGIVVVAVTNYVTQQAGLIQ
ncbi:hypothetical protein [Isoptericola sp. NPDC019482]|uniref:hypothetical protein n=1 Tax=Isoptericola sp. NPDC019482 TaxID=3154688 RepID=UPI0034882D0E